MTIVEADIVVAGAGHNSLITAAYLAAAGHDVVVLDARAIPGGGAATEELLGPGYLIDSCSTGHTLIQTNPLLLRDELGLVSEHGLEYLAPDPFAHVAFPDGEHLTAWMDLDRTCEEIARFDAADAGAYRRLIAEYDEVKAIFGAVNWTPVGFGPSLDERLADHPGGGIWRKRCVMSAWDVVRHEFRDRHVQAFMLWLAYQTMVPVDAPGTGSLVYSIPFGRQRRSWSLPRGGSGRLTDSLARVIARHGGVIRCGERITRLLLDDGRCAGVETERGDQYLASRAVVSSIHVKHLVEMAPQDAWGGDFVYGVANYDIGPSCMAVYLATAAAPEFAAPSGARSAVSAGLAGWPQQVIDDSRALRDGRWVDDPAWVLIATPTLVDPARAPAGRHTVKFLAAQGYGFPQRKNAQADRLVERLRAVAPGFTDDVILDRLVKAPEDIEASNEHMIRGTYHGGDRGIGQVGALRPVPGWAQHRMPIPGLYQTGGTTHPGGSITGGPGRNAAAVLLHDLGTSLEEVVARRAAARSA
ncbi:MAG TPA: NAD(P)/FAD-dependent oxidoreductase [Solirubrobacteraceae bacterium]|jgi:phytoene dehydrogenase-like protein|nr:NAD(P)/FAD-dependent oxidoreductase [Solirubrobacteraceae bacterium]